MASEWLVWAGVLFTGFVLVELIRLDILFARAQKRELKIGERLAAAAGAERPLVSVVIPAKDEEGHIEAAIRSVLASDYPSVELVVVNDRSGDRTLEIMERAASSDSRIKVLSVERLPEGWTGKTHAIYQGARHASGDILLFTDADAKIRPDAITLAVSFMLDRRLDMLSLLPGFTERGFIEDAVIPHLAFGLAYYYPVFEVNNPDSPAGLASGCFIMIKKQAYESIGAWEALKSEITEDVAMSKLVKARGLKQNLLQGGDLVKTRPFTRLSEACHAWKRILYGGLEKSVPKLARLATNYVTLALIGFLFLWSGALCLTGSADLPTVLILAFASLAIVAMSGPLAFYISGQRGNWPYGFTAPLGALIGAWVAVGALMAVLADKGVDWRGSRYK